MISKLNFKLLSLTKWKVTFFLIFFVEDENVQWKKL